MDGNTHATVRDRDDYDLTEEEIDLLKASARYYERRSRDRARDEKTDMWIAIALYLIISGAAYLVW